jgi:hypothetical protein
VLRVDPEGAAQRHDQRRKDRRVELIPLPDAMAQPSAYLPAEQAIACYQRLHNLASKARTPDEPDTSRNAPSNARRVLRGMNPPEPWYGVSVPVASRAGRTGSRYGRASRWSNAGHA